MKSGRIIDAPQLNLPDKGVILAFVLIILPFVVEIVVQKQLGDSRTDAVSIGTAFFYFKGGKF